MTRRNITITVNNNIKETVEAYNGEYRNLMETQRQTLF